MKQKKLSPADIWKEYAAGQSYNTGIEIYDTVKQNENFYIGKQWEDVAAPDLEKPVLNFLKRVVTYLIATLASNDIGVSIKTFSGNAAEDKVIKLLESEIGRVIEKNKIKARARDMLRDCCVDGDGCFYFWFDPSAPTGQTASGEIRAETAENTKVIFGNPFIPEVQEQPYIIFVQRLMLAAAREMAEDEGIDPQEIRPDGESIYAGEDKDTYDSLVTVLVRMWKDKESGTIHFTRSTADVIIKPDTDLGYRLYPLAWMCWDKIKGSYHGQAAITGLLPNQIYVNKLWAMAMQHVKLMAFPKVFYNKNVIKEWSNKVGQAIGVIGNPNEAVAANFRSADLSAQLLELVDRTITYTKEFMGASDAALGNIKPDNTSAIIATQRATAVPLELQRLAYYQFVEDYIRIIIDMMRANYGQRTVNSQDENGARIEAQIDFGLINLDAMEFDIDIGSGAYWSEIMQVNTLDNLFRAGVIGDAVTYLESMPDKYIPNKARLVETLKVRQAQALAVQGQRTAVPQTAQNQGINGPGNTGSLI